MSRGKRDPEYPFELESQFILRLPEEVAKALHDALSSDDSLKNRLFIQINDDMRFGELKFDHWHLHSKIVDLPTIIESLKTIDNKNFYKTADICQIIICTTEPNEMAPEDQSSKNKKKDLNKVDKNFLYPNGLTPPTKNIRKKRFRKTLNKKRAESPDVEKELKKLLQADHAAESFTWELVIDEDAPVPVQEPDTPTLPVTPEKKTKKGRSATKKAKLPSAAEHHPSTTAEIFGEAVSDSDADEDGINAEMRACQLSSLQNNKPGNSSNDSGGIGLSTVGGSRGKKNTLPIESGPPILTFQSNIKQVTKPTCTVTKSADLSSDSDKETTNAAIKRLQKELEDLKLRRQITITEMEGMENSALKRRFQDAVLALNQDIIDKELQYQGLITLQNSE